MKKLIVVLAALSLTVSVAEARPHHRHHHHYRHHHSHHRHHRHHGSSHTLQVHNEARPRQCYGIAWCGCWLRIQKGINDTRYNLASWWHNFGRRVAGPVVGAVARLNHHVGIVVGVSNRGNPIIKSGNHGGRVATAEYPAHRIIEYRM